MKKLNKKILKISFALSGLSIPILALSCARGESSDQLNDNNNVEFFFTIKFVEGGGKNVVSVKTIKKTTAELKDDPNWNNDAKKYRVNLTNYLPFGYKLSSDKERTNNYYLSIDVNIIELVKNYSNEEDLNIINSLGFLSNYQKEYFVSRLNNDTSKNEIKSIISDARFLNSKMQEIHGLLDKSQTIKNNTNVKYYFASQKYKDAYENSLNQLKQTKEESLPLFLSVDKINDLISQYNKDYQNLDGEKNANIDQYRNNIIIEWNKESYFSNDEKQWYIENVLNAQDTIEKLEIQNEISIKLNNTYKKINSIFNLGQKTYFVKKIKDSLRESGSSRINSLNKEVIDYLSLEQESRDFYKENYSNIKNSEWLKKEDQNNSVANSLQKILEFSTENNYALNHDWTIINNSLDILKNKLPIIMKYQEYFVFIQSLTSLRESQSEHYFNLLKNEIDIQKNKENATSLNEQMLRGIELIKASSNPDFTERCSKATQEQKEYYNKAEKKLNEVLYGEKQNLYDPKILTTLIDEYEESMDRIGTIPPSELIIQTLQQVNLTQNQKLFLISKINKEKNIKNLEKNISNLDATTNLLKKEFGNHQSYWSDNKFINASNESQTEFLKVHNEVNEVFLNVKKEKIIDNEYLKTILNKYQNAYNNLLAFESSSDFSNQFKAKSKLNINSDINKYNLKLNPLSFSKENFDLYTTKNIPEDFSAKLIDFNVKPKNYTSLEVNYEISDKNHHKDQATLQLNLQKNEYDLEKNLNSINYSKMEELYDFDKDIFSFISLEDLKNPDQIKLLFKKKLDKIGRFFDYEINPNSIKINREINSEKKEYSIIFEVLVKYKNQVFKSLNLSMESGFNSINNLSFLPTQTFRDSGFYTNTFNTNKLLINYIQQLFDNDTKKEGIYDGSKWYIHSSTQISNAKRKEILTKIYKNNFTIIFGLYSDYEASELEQNENSFALFNESTNELTIGIKFLQNNLEGKESKKLVTIQPEDFSKWEQDYIDFKSIYNLINNDKPEDQKLLNILSSTNVKKGIQKTHNNYIASEGRTKLNDIYDFPQMGRYSLKVDNDSLASLEFNDQKTWANIKFRIYKNNKPLTDSKSISPTFQLQNFKFLTQWDIKPKNNKNYSESDFINYSTGNSNFIEDKKIIEKINGRHFKPKRILDVSWISGERIIQQNAYEKLVYLLDINPTQYQDPSDGKTKNPESLDPKDIIYYKDTEKYNDVTIKKIIEEYFFYFIKDESYNDLPDGKLLHVKIGFVNKQNTNIRFLSKGITFTNLITEYDKELEPFILLNNLTPSDFQFNPAILNNSIRDFVAKVHNNSLGSDQILITNQNAFKTHQFEAGKSTYLQQDISNTLKIADVWIVNYNQGTVFVRLKWDLNGYTYEGGTWYTLQLNKEYNKTQSFQVVSSEEEILKRIRVKKLKYGPDISSRDAKVQGVTDNHLTKIFLKNDLVLRERDIEIDWIDNIWTLDKNNNVASWLFKKKYFDAILNKQNNKEATIKVHLNGNFILLDNNRGTRIFGEREGINLNINYESLKSSGHLTQTFTTTQTNGSKSNYQPFKYQIIATLNSEGILFELKMLDNSYKIVQGNIQENLHIYSNSKPSQENNNAAVFDKKRAFYIDIMGSNIKIAYKNNVTNEKFGNDTNLIDYKNMSYAGHANFTPERYPLVLYSKDYEIDPFGYNPNQNLLYKLHDGYKFNLSYLHKNYDRNSFVNDLRSRSIKYQNGSATVLGKVNNNPNDGKFYIITNHHIEHNNSVENNLLETLNAKNTIMLSYNGYDNDRQNGTTSGQSNVIWSGTHQISNDGSDSNKFVDLTISIVDVNTLIQNAKQSGKFGLALKLKEWFNLKPLEFQTIFSDYSPVLYGNSYNKTYLPKDMQRFDGAFNSLFNGWPFGNENGYFVTRVPLSQDSISLIRQTKFLPTFITSGNSGTGIQGPGGYYSTINSGVVSLAHLISQNYINPSYNYLGLITDKSKTELDANERSFSASLLKLNAYDPHSYPLPWYWSKSKKK